MVRCLILEAEFMGVQSKHYLNWPYINMVYSRPAWVSGRSAKFQFDNKITAFF